MGRNVSLKRIKRAASDVVPPSLRGRDEIHILTSPDRKAFLETEALLGTPLDVDPKDSIAEVVFTDGGVPMATIYLTPEGQILRKYGKVFQ